MYRSSPRSRFVCELARNGSSGRNQAYLHRCGEPQQFQESRARAGSPCPCPTDSTTKPGSARPRGALPFGPLLVPFPFHPRLLGRADDQLRRPLRTIWPNGASDKDGSGPVEFEDLGSEFPEPGSLFTTPTKIHFRAQYANGVELVCQTAQRGFGIRIEGTEGWADVTYNDRGGLKTSPESLMT